MKKLLGLALVIPLGLASCGQQESVVNSDVAVSNTTSGGAVLQAQAIVNSVRPGSCNVGTFKKPPCYFPGAGSGSTFYEGPYRITNTGGAGMEVRVYYYWNDVEFRYCNLNYGQSCDTGWYGNSIRTYVKVWPKTTNGTSYFNISPY